MGAGQSVWEEAEHPWIAEEKRMLREAVPAGVPYFGVCFGAQILASAFGARGYRGLEAELGITQVFLTAAARRDPVFGGFPPDLEVCEWHANHFELPAGGVRLARSPRYENQAVRFGRVAYGIQCHLETSREDLEAWLELFPDTVGQFEARHGEGSCPRSWTTTGASCRACGRPRASSSAAGWSMPWRTGHSPGRPPPPPARGARPRRRCRG